MNFYKGALDGKMGQQTRSSIEAFQGKYNMVVTGKIDTKTFAEIKKQLALQARNKSSLNKKNAGTKAENISYDIKKIQVLLNNAGFYKDKIDGRMGQKTVKAIKEFQKSKNLKQSGVVNARTWEELGKFENRR